MWQLFSIDHALIQLEVCRLDKENMHTHVLDFFRHDPAIDVIALIQIYLRYQRLKYLHSEYRFRFLQLWCITINQILYSKIQSQLVLKPARVIVHVQLRFEH